MTWDGGVLLLNGSDSYQGNTTIGTSGNAYYSNAGANPTLRLGNAAALPPSTTVIFGSDANKNTATLDLYGQSTQVAGLSGGTNAIVNNSAAAAVTLTLGNSGASNTFAGKIRNTSGTLSLVMSGSGTQVLAGSNTYTGGTTLAAGVLDFAAGSLPLGTGKITFNGGTLQWAAGNIQDVSAGIAPIAGGQNAILDTNGNNVSFATGLSGNGGVVEVGSGTLTLSASNGYTGTTLVSGGTLLLANTAALAGSTFDTSGSGSLSFGTLTSATFGGLQGSGNLTLNNTTPAAVALSVGGNNASTTFSGGLSGSGSLTKLGAGMLDADRA